MKHFQNVSNTSLVSVVACLMFFCIVLALTGCGSTPHKPISARARVAKPHNNIEQLLRSEANRWKGTPHRLGGNSRKGIDCSGFVSKLYKNLFNIRLPRSTKDQVRVGKPVSRIQIRAGDLVFFLPPRKSRHVGIYLGRGEFVHASSTNGVMISSMTDPYWRKCYWKARRVL
jgi:cell wall-associated NlpC family hydrolase